MSENVFLNKLKYETIGLDGTTALSGDDAYLGLVNKIIQRGFIEWLSGDLYIVKEPFFISHGGRECFYHDSLHAYTLHLDWFS